MKSKIINWLGWYGVAATVLAYILISFSGMSGGSFLYQGLNFTGALGITVETYYRKDYQPFWLNAVWALIAMAAIFNLILRIRK